MKRKNKFIIFVLILGIKEQFNALLPTVHACLPRIRKAGNAASDTDNTFDKQALERAKWTTNDWIVRHNYALEQHTVITKDGYQLQLQRLPKPAQRAVILVHGLLTSSLGWVMLGPAKSLAFLLFDKNYDVWLANLRGSMYGRNHTHLNVSSAEFWNFSFHEHGLYDLPAIIDHVRMNSPFHQVLLISHSQAFNAFLVMCSLLPEYNERVLFMQALAPLAKLRGMVKFKPEDAKLIMKYVKAKRKAQKYELVSPGDLKSKCLKRNSEDRKQCLRIFDTFAGIGQHTRSLDPIIFGQLLHGGSLKEITHLYQLWQSGDFVHYDYGHLQNPRYYNSVSPHSYDLQSITVPMILHFGETDASATPNGVHNIYSHLINSKSIYGVYRVASSKFNHFDFLISNDAQKLINNKIIEIMENYFAGKLKYVIE